MGLFIRVDGIPAQRRIVPMLAIRITGNQLRAGRSLADLSIEDLAARAPQPRRRTSARPRDRRAPPDRPGQRTGIAPRRPAARRPAWRARRQWRAQVAQRYAPRSQNRSPATAVDNIAFFVAYHFLPTN